MTAKSYLTEEQKSKLQQYLKSHEHPDVRERILIILLQNDGKTQKEIADFVGCSLRKVAYWCVHGDPGNLESFNDKRMEGNYRKATDEYIEILLKVIDQDPEELGYEFGNWTAQRLAEHLDKETGIKLSSRQIRRILKSRKYVYIWSKYSLEERQDPEKRKLFKAKLSEYMKIAEESPERLQIWFWDESGFNLKGIKGKTWTKKGKRKKIPGRRRKGRANVMGGLRFSDKKRYVDFLPKGNGEGFHIVLKGLYEEIKYEWADSNGKDVSSFEEEGPKIVIILDNASLHKKKEIIKKIEEEMPNIILEFLPEYSPDYNLIELVWHSAKEFISNRVFKSLEELELLLHKLLNEGELIIRWGRKLKNKGNAINAV